MRLSLCSRVLSFDRRCWLEMIWGPKNEGLTRCNFFAAPWLDQPFGSEGTRSFFLEARLPTCTFSSSTTTTAPHTRRISGGHTHTAATHDVDAAQRCCATSAHCRACAEHIFGLDEPSLPQLCIYVAWAACVHIALCQDCIDRVGSIDLQCDSGLACGFV